jgi:hypothetical protein
MLAYILAIAIGSSSLVLFMTAFVQPEIHRKDDFLWSGIGLFYALVLWFCANRLTGGVLLGQAAAVALILSYNWQNLKLRKAIAHPEKEITLDFSITQAIQNFLGRSFSRSGKSPSTVKAETATTTPPETDLETVEPSLEEESQPTKGFPSLATKTDKTEIIDAQIEAPTTETTGVSPTSSETEITDTTTVEPKETTLDLSQQPKNQKRSFSLGNLFGFGKKKTIAATTGKSQLSNLDAILDEEIEQPTAATERTEDVTISGESITENTEFEAIDKDIISNTESNSKTTQESQIVEIIDRKNKAEDRSELMETEEEQIKSGTETTNLDISEEQENQETSSFTSDSASDAIPPEPPTSEMIQEAQQKVQTQAETEAINGEEIAPEVELAPPVESLGEGEPTIEKNLEEPSDRSQQQEQKE